MEQITAPPASGAPASAARNQDRAGRPSIGQSLKEYGRGIVGGLLFSLPLLYTMEVWWHGMSAEPWQLMIFLLAIFGVLLGYNSICGLHPDNRLAEVIVESVEELGLALVLVGPAIARRYWQEAGIAGRIALKLGPARETLDAMITAGAGGSYDFAFIDADKTGYAAYHERVLQLLRPGGLIAYDNVLWSGRVADPQDTSADTEALRALNIALAQDRRVVTAMLPVGDGVTLPLKL